MNRRLWWKLSGTLALGTLVLFWVISFLGTTTEQQISFIARKHQETLQDWGHTAERLYLAGDEQAFARWLEQLQREENTWAAVVQSERIGRIKALFQRTRADCCRSIPRFYPSLHYLIASNQG